MRLVLELIYEEHLHTVEPSMNTISKFKQPEHTQANRPGMILIVESQGQESSAGLKHSKAYQPLTL